MLFPKTLTQREIPAFSTEVWKTLPEAGEWTIDLAAVKVIDSSFLALLLEMVRRAEAKSLKLKIISLPADARALMEVYGIFSLFEEVAHESK